MCKPTREESSVPREPLDAHAHIVVDGLMAGRVIPLLGAGVNLVDRPPGDPWQAGRELPNGAELAVHLAQRFSYTEEPIEDLARVSQYVATMSGSGPLYEELRTVFAVHRRRPVCIDSSQAFQRRLRLPAIRSGTS